jgi:hypothetical protein
VAPVECDPACSGKPSASDRLQPGQAYRTGRLAHLKRHVFAQVFDLPLDADQALVFVELGVIERIQSLVPPAAH